MFLCEIRYYDRSGELQLTLLFNVLERINAIRESLIDIFYGVQQSTSLCAIVFKRETVFTVRQKDARAGIEELALVARFMTKIHFYTEASKS